MGIDASNALKWNKLLIILLLVQVILGGFVAGLNAGLIYNEFPHMGDGFLPDELWDKGNLIQKLSSPVFVQFIHRNMSYIISLMIFVFCLKLRCLGNVRTCRASLYIFLALLLQMLLGVSTLIYQVPISLALMHQLGSILLLSTLLWCCFLLHRTFCAR